MTQAATDSNADPIDSPRAVFPLPVRLLTLLIGAVVGLSAIPGLIIAINQGPHFLIGFEVCVLLAGVFTALIGLGRFSNAPAMGLFIAGGTFICGAFFGEDNTVFVLLNQPFTQGSGVDLVPYAFARIAAGGILLALATLTVLIQNPDRSFRRLALSLVLALPLISVVGALAMPSVRDAFLGLNGIALAGVTIVVMIVTLGFLAASGHWLVRAFEAGLPEQHAKIAP